MDQKVLITGGSRGLGQALCEMFSAQGADVAFTYSKDLKSAEKTLERIARVGKPGHAYRASVLSSEELTSVAKELEKSWGRIDILVNNAGVSQVIPLPVLEEEDWDYVMDTNMKGCYLATRAVLRGMIQRKKGVILNIGSLAGVRLLAAPVHYAASKAAIRGFTEALSKEVARYQIRVNCLAPGLLEEGVAKNLPEQKLEEYLREVALGRTGRFEEVARFATFMVSARNTYMNGATIVMDGGL